MRGPYWHNALGDELRIGRYIVRLKRSLGEGGFAFIHLVEASGVEACWYASIIGSYRELNFALLRNIRLVSNTMSCSGHMQETATNKLVLSR